MFMTILYSLMQNMFKFGFSSDSNCESEKPDVRIKWDKCKEIFYDDVNTEWLKNLPEDAVLKRSYKDVVVKYLNPEIIIERISEIHVNSTSPVLIAEKDHSDLVAGVYEGGLKVWECTHDLCDFVVNSALDLNEKRILDLGCGAGVVGILCHLQGSIMSYFQDYNEDVIKYFTIPNLRLNLNDTELDSVKCKFYTGDWLSFVDLLCLENETDKFDFIFTSETIYNVENYDKLHQVFEKCLKKDGTIFVAAKYYYFGVGGGVPDFKSMLEKKQIFNYKTCWEFNKGVRREILELKFKT